jgi:hypothetical protein
MSELKFAVLEQVNTNLQKLYAYINEVLHGVNAVDNLVPSLVANECRAWNGTTNPFENGGVISHDLIFIGPIGLLLAGLSFGIEVWYQNRYRDDWEAYWALEEERFAKVEKALNELASLQSEQFVEIEKWHLRETNQLFVWFERRVKMLNDIFIEAEKANISEASKKAYREKCAKLQKVTDKLENLKLRINPNPSESDENSRRAATRPLEAEVAFEHAVTRLEKELKKPSPLSKTTTKEKSIWSEAFSWLPDNGLFNVIFAYAWNYWGVFFVTLWGLPTPFAIVPLSWGLMALIAPVAYLFYREYKANQEDRLALEADEEEIKKLSLDANQVRLEYEKRQAERRNNLFIHRLLGWMFVGLVAALSMTVMFDFNFLIGAIVFVGVGLFGVMVAQLSDSHFKQTYLEEKIKNHGVSNDTIPSVDNNPSELLPRKTEAWLHRLAQGYMQWSIRKAKLAYQLERAQASASQRHESEITYSVANASVNPKTYKTTLEKARKIISPVINFFLGYMIGIIIGFPTLDFLSHFMGPTATGPTANAIVGVLGLAVAVSFAVRASDADRAHRKELKAERSKNDYCAKQRQVDSLNEHIAYKREYLKWQINKVKWLKGFLPIKEENDVAPNVDNDPSDEAYQARLALIEPPEKKLNKNKMLKLIRRGLNVLVNISSAMLMSRALFVMGFAAMFAFSNHSIAVIIGLLNPFGITVFAIAAIFLVLKASNEIYLHLEKAKELKKVRFVDLALDCAQGEYAHLAKVEELFNREEKALLQVHVPESSRWFRDFFYPAPEVAQLKPLTCSVSTLLDTNEIDEICSRGYELSVYIPTFSDGPYDNNDLTDTRSQDAHPRK